MPLVKSSLEAALKDALTPPDADAATESSISETVAKLATAIDDYIKSATVTTNGSITVTPGSAVIVTPTGPASNAAPIVGSCSSSGSLS
jgi:hypothetical protein